MLEEFIPSQSEQSKKNNKIAKKKIAKQTLALTLQPSTSQRMPLPLLSDLMELAEDLRPLLRRCEKMLSLQDIAFLSESFEEVNKKSEEVKSGIRINYKNKSLSFLLY